MTKQKDKQGGPAEPQSRHGVVASLSWSVVPAGHNAHCRFEDTVGAAATNWPAVHVVAFLQLAASAASWYVTLGSQDTHMRSVLMVAFWAIRLPAGHTETGRHRG